MRDACLGVVFMSVLACGGGQPAAQRTAASPSTAGILQFDASARTATLNLVAGAGGGFNFNGFSYGRLQITVPVNWAVTVNCSNASPGAHSCGITDDAASSTAAFPGAATPNPTVGMPQGQLASFTFSPNRVGRYRIACLVPGHQESGMWDRFVVAAGGLPSISA